MYTLLITHLAQALKLVFRCGAHLLELTLRPYENLLTTRQILALCPNVRHLRLLHSIGVDVETVDLIRETMGSSLRSLDLMYADCFSVSGQDFSSRPARSSANG